MKDIDKVKNHINNILEEDYKNHSEEEKNIIKNKLLLDGIEYGYLEDLYDNKDAYNLARKYFNLCYNKALNIIDQVNIDNRYITLDSATEFIINTFDHLLYPIAKANKKERLDILNNMSLYQPEKNLSFFTYVLKYFDDDITCLQSILAKMTNPDSEFNIFNSKEKLYLLTNAIGTIYKYNNDEIIYQDIFELNNDLENEILINHQILNNLNKTPEEMDYLIDELDDLIDEFDSLIMSIKKEDQIKVRSLIYKDELNKGTKNL